MSDEFMAEFERLLDAHDRAIVFHERGAEWVEAPMATRAALVAHVERGVLCLCKAELDAADPACYPQAEIMDNNATVGEVPMPEPDAYLYTLEYGETVVNKKVSMQQLNYPFGVCGADYLARNDNGCSYVKQTPLYTTASEAAGYARGLAKETGK
jgi:hypothetical protein